MMRLSDAGRDAIIQREGLRLTAYTCPAGKLTIGIGHTGPDQHPPAAPRARVSSAFTPMQGLPLPWASAFTVATPMRTPVKLPGPVTAARASSSFSATPALSRLRSTMGIRLALWVFRF